MLNQREIRSEQLYSLADGGYVFALIDACADLKLLAAKAREMGMAKAICMFSGTYLQDYDAVAPYLFNVDRAFLEWISLHLGQVAWGVFVFAKEKRDVVLSHLQRFLLVALPDGRKGHFRYYDPVVLQGYLPTCRTEELQVFFGPIRGFAIAVPEEQKTRLFEYLSSPAAQPAQLVYPGGLWPIRVEQFQALGHVSKDHFGKLIAAHVQQYFPESHERLGEPRVTQAIHYGIQKAATYGITMETDVCGFIDLLFALGLEFDQNPQYAWVAAILKDTSRNPTARMTQVREIVARQAEQVG